MYHFINDNFHTDIATVPPSYKMKHFHEHNRWELMFIYSGSCTLYVGDEIYMLNSGGLALIPPDMAHMTTYLAGSDHTRYVLYFNNDDLKWIADDSSLDIEAFSINILLSIYQKDDLIIYHQLSRRFLMNTMVSIVCLYLSYILIFMNLYFLFCAVRCMKIMLLRKWIQVMNLSRRLLNILSRIITMT